MFASAAAAQDGLPPKVEGARRGSAVGDLRRVTVALSRKPSAVLGEHHDVGLHPEVLDGKELAGPPEPRLDLVGDEECRAGQHFFDHQ